MADATIAPAAAPAAAPATAAVPAPVAAPAAGAAAPAADAPLANLFDDPAPAEGDPPKPADKPAEAKPGDDAPVAYELKLPDGLTLTDEQLSGVKAKLAAAKVSPDQAQPLFDEWVNGVREAATSAAKQSTDLWTSTQKEWQAQIKADPDIGGAKLDQTIATTRKGAETLLGGAAAKELFTALNITGAGNNPAIVKALHKAFSQHAPAQPVTGAPAGADTQRTAGATLYPKQAGLGNASIN